MEFHHQMYLCFRIFSDLNTVRKLLDGGLDPNFQAYGGTTPLHWACMTPFNSIEVVKCLIQTGADVNLANHLGYTPLHLAVIQRKRLVVEELIGQGALINAQNHLGMSALHFAVSDYVLFGTPILDRNHLDMWIVKMLLKHQYIDRDVKNSKGDTPLMLSVKDYHIESVVQLLRSKANPNICNKDFETPLHVALTHPPSCVEIELLICGANIYAVDKYGNTPLDILMNITFGEGNEEWVLHILKLIAFKYSVTNNLKLALECKPKLFQYWNKCCDQVKEMRSDFITGNITMHDFIWSCFNEDQIDNLLLEIYNPVVDRLAKDIYLDYFVEILYLIPIWNLCDILEMKICSAKRGKNSEVTSIDDLLSKIDIIHLISKHLVTEDVFCLIVAFSNIRIPKSLQDVQERSRHFFFHLE